MSNRVLKYLSIIIAASISFAPAITNGAVDSNAAAKMKIEGCIEQYHRNSKQISLDVSSEKLKECIFGDKLNNKSKNALRTSSNMTSDLDQCDRIELQARRLLDPQPQIDAATELMQKYMAPPYNCKF